MQSLASTLQNFGLSEKESQVYIASLSCGTAPASRISENCGIKRITVYEVLKKMISRGLVSESESSGVAQFTALSPSQLFAKIEQNIEDLNQIKPDLESLAQGSLVRPQVRFLHGLEGVKQGYFESLSTEEEVLSIANSQNIRLHWPEYDIEYVQRRADKKIFLRGVAPRDDSGEKAHKEDNQYFRDLRLLKRDLFPPEMVENEICIFGDTVLIASFEPDIFAILITSPAVVQTQKQIFEVLWKVANQV